MPSDVFRCAQMPAERSCAGRMFPLAVLLDASLLEKVIYELGYELNNRPDWTRIPVHGLLKMLATTPAGEGYEREVGRTHISA
jgi:hypothetical protein